VALLGPTDECQQFWTIEKFVAELSETQRVMIGDRLASSNMGPDALHKESVFIRNIHVDVRSAILVRGGEDDELAREGATL
jgi:hypothetical protein